jgi:mannosyl-oligosaccharide glucosidase
LLFIVSDQILTICLELHWNQSIRWYSDYAGIPGINETRNEFSDHIGYVSLFPFLFGLVDIESEEIETLFKYIQDSKFLWTNYGLRSLSASDPLAGTKENYWRGPIWMNINYLTLRALKQNIVRDVPSSNSKAEENRQKAKKIYTDLRNALITNLKTNFARFRTIHEQYSPFDGKGERAYPFTGWSSLIVLIMGELF